MKYQEFCSEFKKGVLELIVLLTISKKDIYGYELILEVSKIIDVNEGTIYPLLKRLTNDKYLDSYLQESNEGPSRKYYKLTILGKDRLSELLSTWNEFQTSVNKYIKGSSENE